jgi:hypothetical protein
MSGKLDDLLEVSKQVGTAAPVPVAATARRYENLLAVSGSISAYGRAIKILGLVMGAGGLIGGVVGLASSNAWGFGLAILGVFLGLVLHASGTVIAAMGEGLLALADIATNTARG